MAWKLWQNHEVTAKGEQEIIARANDDLVYEYEFAKILVSKPVVVLRTIQQARAHFNRLGSGYVDWESES